MRALLAVACLLSLLVVATGCTDPSLTGECVTGIDFTDEAQIVPDPSPFYFCPVDPNAKKADGTTPDNLRFGSIVLHNCGRLSIKVESATLANQDIEVFSDVQLEATDIAPGKEVAMRFLYTAKDLAEHHAIITVKSNAKNFPDLQVELVVRANGTTDGGVCPRINPDAGVEDR